MPRLPRPYPDPGDGRPSRHLPQAVHDDRRPDAVAAERLPGDGRADPLPPGAGLRRGLLARARTAAAVFQTAQRVLCFAASGTGAMESAVANLVAPGEPAMVASCGKFGQRWARALRRLRRRARPTRVRVGREGRPRAPRRGARRRASSRARLRHPVGDLDRRAQRHPRPERGRARARRRSSASTRSRGSAPSTCRRTNGASTSSSPARRSR